MQTSHTEWLFGKPGNVDPHRHYKKALNRDRESESRVVGFPQLFIPQIKTVVIANCDNFFFLMRAVIEHINIKRL